MGVDLLRAVVLVLAPALAALGLDADLALEDLADTVLAAVFFAGALLGVLAGALLDVLAGALPFAFALAALFLAGARSLDALDLAPEVLAVALPPLVRFSTALGSATAGFGAPNFKRTGFSPQI